MLQNPNWDLKTELKYDNFLSAEYLKLTEEQHYWLIETLKCMEAGQISEKVVMSFHGHQVLFKMADWLYEDNDWGDGLCGTTCCIGGTACLLSGNKYLFGFTNTQVSKPLYDLFYRFGSVNTITVERGAQKLREYLETGECEYNWS